MGEWIWNVCMNLKMLFQTRSVICTYGPQYYVVNSVFQDFFSFNHCYFITQKNWFHICSLYMRPHIYIYIGVHKYQYLSHIILMHWVQWFIIISVWFRQLAYYALMIMCQQEYINVCVSTRIYKCLWWPDMFGPHCSVENTKQDLSWLLLAFMENM